MRAEQSRTIRAAAKAAGAHESELEETLNAAATHLRVDPVLPGALPTTYLLAATLLRGPGRITIDERDLSAAQLAPLNRLTAELRPGRQLQLATPPPPTEVRRDLGPLTSRFPELDNPVSAEWVTARRVWSSMTHAESLVMPVKHSSRLSSSS